MTAKPSTSQAPIHSERVISPKADRLLRRMTTSAAVVVGLFAAIMSFAGLRAWGIDHGVHPNLAFALPLIIDGMMLSAALFYSHASLRGRRSGPAFLTLAGGVGLSIYGNVSHGWTGTVDGIFVHAAAPIALLVSLEFALSLMRKRLTDEAVEAQIAVREEAKAQRAQERAAKRSQEAVNQPSQASVVTQAPTARKAVSKPSTAPARGIDQARVQAVRDLIASTDFRSSTDGLSNVEIAAHILQAVPGVTPPEAVQAGAMAEAGDKGRASYMRVQRAFKKALERGVEVEAPASQEIAADEPSVPSERRLMAVGV